MSPGDEISVARAQRIVENPIRQSIAECFFPNVIDKMNFQSSKPGKPGWKKILIVAVILLIAGYQWYSENAKRKDVQNDIAVVDVNDSRYDARLPEEFEAGNPNGAVGSPKVEAASSQSDSSTRRSADLFVSVGRNKLKSPAGLIYGMGGGGEHRVDHVMRHAKDDPSRPSHGVFDGDKDSILRLIDEAYEMVKSNSRYVKTESSQGNTAYTISMGRVVGYEGGQKGKRSNHKRLKSIRLILDGNRVITAYPYR